MVIQGYHEIRFPATANTLHGWLNHTLIMRISQLTFLLAAALTIPIGATAGTTTVLGWNNLGMHCMDSDYSVFSVLPPYNTIECQLIVNGLLVTNGGGYSVTYQGVADPSGSFNSTSIGKGNYYSFVQAFLSVGC